MIQKFLTIPGFPVKGKPFGLILDNVPKQCEHEILMRLNMRCLGMLG